MRTLHACHTFSLRCAAGALALAFAVPIHAEQLDNLNTEELRKKIVELTERIDKLKQTVAAEEATLSKIRHALGMDGANPPRSPQTRSADAAKTPAQPAPAPTVAKSEPGSEDKHPPQVAALFDQPGVLTPRGKVVLEPSLQYTYASSNRVALVGYTIIPAIVIGLIDVREVKRNTTTAALTGRWGLTNRLELEAKVPAVYRSDSTIERPLSSGAAQDNLFSSNGKGIGDIEFTGRYQFNDGGADDPYYIGTLRFKTRTGKDPFEVVTATSVPGGGLNTQLQRDLPTGSGFYTLQPGLTALYASDPAVFFGSLSYQYNFSRDHLQLNTDSGPQEIGKVKPGDVLGFNFGMGLALNDKASFSIGYDHAVVGRTRINDNVVTNSVTTQLGTLLFGFSYRVSDRTTMNLSVGVGATRDAPDLQLSLRLPMSF